jgi:hypothetical protein
MRIEVESNKKKTKLSSLTNNTHNISQQNETELRRTTIPNLQNIVGGSSSLRKPIDTFIILSKSMLKRDIPISLVVEMANLLDKWCSSTNVFVVCKNDAVLHCN